MAKNDNSDYNKIRTNLYELLPDVFRSDTNLSVFENTFNRFLTKSEFDKVSGIIGASNPNALVKRQIQEPTQHRQAFQLQPILYDKIGTIEHMASWVDIKNELAQLGVDTDKFDEWGRTVKFNWIPPVDLDKIINYRDYYWFDSNNPSSRPQYLTIRNKCNVVTARTNFHQSLIDQYGSTFLIKELNPTESAIIVDGDQHLLFDPGFIFFIKNSPNVDLNNSFQTVVSSTFDEDDQETTIVIDFTFIDSTPAGVLSLEEELSALIADQQCQCEGTTGWDIALWDDNQIGSVLWADQLLTNITHPTEAAWIVANGTPVLYDIWFDTTTSALKQYDGATFVVVINNFSLIVIQVRGTEFWELSTRCGDASTIGTTADQWINENHWLHKNDVPNFSKAKQATLPIIEYFPDLELNEWTHTEYEWKYRASKFASFEETTAAPTTLELFKDPHLVINDGIKRYAIDVGNNEIVFDEQYGDMTDIFVEDFTFLADGTPVVYEVIRSRYRAAAAGLPYQTRVTIDTSSFIPADVSGAGLDPIDLSLSAPSTIPIRPRRTSQGDVWRAFDEHWLFVGAKPTTAINHQDINPFIEVQPSSVIVTDPDYNYQVSSYTQEYTLTSALITDFPLSTTTVTGSIRDLTKRALIGFDTVRVYVNDIRQIGTYDEQTEVDLATGLDDTHVAGIKFHNPTIGKFDIVRVEVGEAAVGDLGLSEFSVRNIENEDDFIANGSITISLINKRKIEQIKTKVNQYPLFDIYKVTGESALEANNIFGFLESPDADIAGAVGLRIVRDGTVFSFEQTILKEDDGELFAYRDYNNFTNPYWVNTDTNEVKFWTGLTWSPTTDSDDHLMAAIVSDEEPILLPEDVDCAYWYDTVELLLKKHDEVGGTWDEVTNVDYVPGDKTLQTIWRVGSNKEEYIPSYVDEDRNPVPIGDPLGEWEIPDQLYFNHMHENRVVLTSRELLGHFRSVIQNQPKIPAYNGPRENMYHLLLTEDVNFGLGGTIKEYNDGFDTLLSSIFVKNITPPTLYEFAQDQYENSLNTLVESFRRNATDLLINTSDNTITDFEGTISTAIIDQYEQNDAFGIVFGDSTTFDDETDLGVRNWIATLPYFNLVGRRLPEFITDDDRGISSISHHDGHRNSYTLAAATVESITQQVINTPDVRVTDIDGNPTENIGRLSGSLPPNTVSEFIANFSVELRDAVYWFTTTTTPVVRTLYRLNAFISDVQPAITHPDGTLWMDLTPAAEVLRVKSGASWNVVSGLVVGDARFHNGTNPADVTTATVSAWQVVDLDSIVGETILDVETKLYENAPDQFQPVFDFSSLQDTASEQVQYRELLEEQFFAFARENEVVDPLSAQGHFVASDPFTWNYKHSAPGTQYEIVDLDSVAETFTVEGDKTTIFAAATQFFIKNAQVDNGQWTTVSSAYSIIDDETIITVVEDVQGSLATGIIYGGLLPSTDNTGAESGGDWRDLYEKLYGTPYPHLEPWKLQNYIDKPSWWDVEYVNDNPITWGNRRWKYIHATTTGMWEEIRIGRVPVGQLLPDGSTLSTGAAGEAGVSYNYFSVNIADVDISANGGATVFNPDDVLPPLFDFAAAGEPVVTNNRSIFSAFTVELVSPGLDYIFGDAGPFEWEWRNDSQFLYDQLIVAFKMEPMRFMHQTFGIEFIEVGCLQIDKRTLNTFSHNRTDWHGELEDDVQYLVDGTNQWYVNNNRATGFDTAYSDFRALWTLWTAPMMYQFASFVERESFDIGNRNVAVSQFDYDITLKKSPGVEDHWLHSFDVSVLQTAPDFKSVDNQSKYRFSINTFSPLHQPVEYYAVHNYQFIADKDTDICTLYTYPVIGVDGIEETFEVQGNQTEVFTPLREFDITGSTGNDQTWTVTSSAYDSTADKTIIVVVEEITNGIVDGLITADYRVLPWETGDVIYFSTGQALPIPLRDDIAYFIIKINDTQFQIANTPADADNNLPMNLTSPGIADQFISQLMSTFTALGGAHTDKIWRNYAVDTSLIKTFNPPFVMNGVQHLVDIVRGYNVLTTDAGFVINEDKSALDPDTGRIIDWQIEMERFIDFAYQLQIIKQKVPDRFESVVDDVTNIWTFVAETPQYITGDPVSVLASGAIPQPITSNITYYIIRDSLTEFRLAATKRDAEAGVELDILPLPNVGTLYLALGPDRLTGFPRQEINPFRYGVWFAPERGIVSDLTVGPFADVRTEQLLFDQYGRRLGLDTTNILRQDKLTRIRVSDEVPNDRQLTSVFNDVYNFIHLAGTHLFLDTYEHVLKFNNYTSADALLYDPFIGLNVAKFDIVFNRQVEFTQRPNVGGYFLLNNNLTRNIEAQIDDMRQYFDTFRVSEDRDTTKRGRGMLGYEGSEEFLDNLNVNPKSQFLFWRGMIQHKGARTAIAAFINSRRFIGASVDEFWARKIAEYGSAEEKEYPEMFVTTDDAKLNEFRMEFIRQDQDCTIIDSTFECITLNDEGRWFNQPDQLLTLRNNGLGLYFDMEVTDSIAAIVGGALQPPVESASARDFIRHNFMSDGSILTFGMYADGTIDSVIAAPGTAVTITAYVPDTNMIKVFVDNVLQEPTVDYTEDPGTLFYSTGLTFTTAFVGGEQVDVVYGGGTLIDGLHFTDFTSNVVEVLENDVLTLDRLTLWVLSEDKQALNPVKVRDIQSEVVITTVPIWNPARGYHYHNALQVVDLFNVNDPAVYTSTPRTVIIPAAPPVVVDPWNAPEVGTVWLDTTNLDYVPYYDTNVFDLEERSNTWGNLAEWGEIKLYEWVESDVPPSEWNALALQEENDVSIPESARKSGTVRELLYKKDGATTDFILIENVFDEHNVLLDETAPGNRVFDITNIAADMVQDLAAGIISAGPVEVEVYVNGTLRETTTVLDTATTITVLDTVDVDTVRIIRRVPTDASVIDPLIDSGLYKREVEYSVITTRNPANSDLEINTYYFWVDNKLTSRDDKLMSITSATTQLAVIPSPYMYLQKPIVSPEDLIIGTVDQQKTNTYNATAAQAVFELTLPVKDALVANVLLVTVNGTEELFTLNVAGTEVTLLTPASPGDLVHINYVTLYDETASLPSRYVQAIVRGLRGTVNDNRRYTLRFTRDFTLRDTLDTGDTPLQNKNLHAEWQMFRENQQYHIARDLWNNVTECMIGFKLSDSSVRVPSLQRELYDATNHTDTQYGLGTDQAFANGVTALQSILFDLNNPDNDFKPVDINVFFNNNSFDTPENIIQAMDTIYNTFTFESVNRMYFSVLQDSLSVKNHYPDLFKTSWLSLHGIRVLEVGGIFDD